MYNHHVLIVTLLPNASTQPVADDNKCALKWMTTRHRVRCFATIDDIDTYLHTHDFDLVYCIKHGQLDDTVFRRTPFVVHCVFDMSQPHGRVYAAVSRTVANSFGNDLFVPHMVSLTPIPAVSTGMASLRHVLHIPKDAIVFGRHGGMDTFNLPWFLECVNRLVDAHRHIYFLFMNTPQWRYHPQIVHIPAIANTVFKQRFIEACDAMVVPESLGHTFGLSIAEFQVFHKPIFCFDNGYLWNRAHVDILGTSAAYFSNDITFELAVFAFIVRRRMSINAYAEFTPRRVMETFSRVFLDQQEIQDDSTVDTALDTEGSQTARK
jgi:hypothetical protein